MLMHDRDRQILLTVARFGQASAGQLRSLHFADVSSVTPLRRALKRLVAHRLLAVIERRMVGGSGAGSGQYVYQLGSAGWTFTGRAGRYYPLRVVNYHTLAIVDAYVELVEMEREGRLSIEAVSSEPDSWMTIAGADLRPDLYVELTQDFTGRRWFLWLEIDMGTERQKAIKDKLARYWHAYQSATEEDLPAFPLVVFIAPDDARARELRWIVERGSEDAQRLFFVLTPSEWPRLLLS